MPATLFDTSVYEPDFVCGVVWFIALLFAGLWFTGYFDEQPQPALTTIKQAPQPAPASLDPEISLNDKVLRSSLDAVVSKPLSAEAAPTKRRKRRSRQPATVP